MSDESPDGKQPAPDPPRESQSEKGTQLPGDIDLSEGRKGNIALPAVPIQDVVDEMEALPDAPPPANPDRPPPPTDSGSDSDE